MTSSTNDKKKKKKKILPTSSILLLTPWNSTLNQISRLVSFRHKVFVSIEDVHVTNHWIVSNKILPFDTFRDRSWQLSRRVSLSKSRRAFLSCEIYRVITNFSVEPSELISFALILGRESGNVLTAWSITTDWHLLKMHQPILQSCTVLRFQNLIDRFSIFPFASPLFSHKNHLYSSYRLCGHCRIITVDHPFMVSSRNSIRHNNSRIFGRSWYNVGTSWIAHFHRSSGALPLYPVGPRKYTMSSNTKRRKVFRVRSTEHSVLSDTLI